MPIGTLLINPAFRPAGFFAGPGTKLRRPALDWSPISGPPVGGSPS